MDPERSSVRLVGKGNNEEELLMSTQELLSYDAEMTAARGRFAQTGNKQDLAAPEATIRGHHRKKDAMLAELTSIAATLRRSERSQRR